MLVATGTGRPEALPGADSGFRPSRVAAPLFVEGYGNFVKCRRASGRVLLTAETLRHLESQLPPPPFLRVHKPYLVRVVAVERLSGNVGLGQGRAAGFGHHAAGQVWLGLRGAGATSKQEQRNNTKGAEKQVVFYDVNRNEELPEGWAIP